jgi:hypothetical protein
LVEGDCALKTAAVRGPGSGERGLGVPKTDLNALGRRIRDSLVREHPEWTECVETLETGDLELAVRAPHGSRAKNLIIFTSRGEDIWIRYAPPRMCYCVET